MVADEPFATALLLTTFGALLAASILFSRGAEKGGIPLALIFLVLGMAAGSEGVGRIEFENYELAFRLGSTALALILFDGGLNTPLSAVRDTIRPAGALATLGVAATAGVVALGGRALGFDWPVALLIGVVVSSTDAAAVFSVLRGSGIRLDRKVATTLEVESGLNDPLAVILTAEVTRYVITGGEVRIAAVAFEVVLQIAIGAAIGLAAGFAARVVLRRYRLSAGGLYPALTLAVAFLAFGVSTLLHGSGFLAVYLAAVVLGNSEFPHRTGVLRVHDTLAWLSQIVMFLVLGLLVFPSRLVDVAGVGLVVGLLLALVARPLAVALCLLPFRYSLRDVAFISWVGLRGAVPIVLATFPVLARAPGAERIFDVVFFIVVVNVLLQGTTVPWLARRLRLEARDPPPPAAVLEIESLQPLNGRLLSFYVDEALAVTGVPLAELPFPPEAAVTMVIRGNELVAPKGQLALRSGDHVYVFARDEDQAFIQLMFGRPEAS